MRRVARRPTTQHAWCVAQQGKMSFFPGESVHELDVVQLALVKWILFYDWVLSLGLDERPTDADIDDDRELDRWHRRQREKILAEIAKSRRD